MRNSPLPTPLTYQHSNSSLFSVRHQFSPPAFLSAGREQPWDTRRVARAELLSSRGGQGVWGAVGLRCLVTPVWVVTKDQEVLCPRGCETDCLTSLYLETVHPSGDSSAGVAGQVGQTLLAALCLPSPLPSLIMDGNVPS